MKSVKDLISVRNLVALTALVVLAAVLVERLWVTDEERIDALLTRAADHGLKGEWGAVADLLHPEFQFEGMNRQEVAKVLEATFQKTPLKKCSVTDRKIEVQEGGTARATVRVIIRGAPNLPHDGMILLDLELGFLKTEAGWRVSAMKMID